VNKVVELEDLVKQNERKKIELKKEIKQLEKINHDQGNELERLENGVDHHLILSSLTEKLRVWKDKESKMIQTIQREEDAISKQKERVTILKEAKKKLEQEVQDLIKEKGWSEPKKPEVKQGEIE
jgi:hypothetical protein